MEQFRMIGKVLGSLKALMVFKEEIQINQRQCCLLVEIFNSAFDCVSEEIKKNLKFEERHSKWRTIEQPLKELHRIFKEVEVYVHQCLDVRDWWGKVITLANNMDCVETHIHNLLSCMPVVIEAIEMVGEISGSDHDEMQKKRLILAKKYSKEWRDPTLFQWKFGKQYLVSHDIYNRLLTVSKEDKWILREDISRKMNSGFFSRQEQRLAEVVIHSLNEMDPSDGKLFPSSVLVGWKDYQVRRRLGNGSQYKEIQWLGESFAVRHFFGEIEMLIPELSVLSSLAHPNVSQFFGSFSDEEKKECFLVMELMNKDLATFVKETCSPRKRLPFMLPVAVDVMLQIARGMEYLHSRKVYHGDLNPSNVLMKAKTSTSETYFQAKISGFNLSSVKNFTPRSITTQTGGSQNFIWHAPEVLLEQEQPGNICVFKYTEKADVYSFGMICFQLLTGKVPFEDSHLQGDKMSRNIRAGERPLFPFSSPKYLVNLTKRCWQTDPTMRPSFSSICRVLRYIKKFLLMNPDHSQAEMPSPLIDYSELEVGLLKKFPAWESTELMPVTQIPFQMFAYKVTEKEKIHLNLRERSSESGSDGASVNGDENMGTVEDPFPPTAEKKPVVVSSESTSTPKKGSARKFIDYKSSKPGTPKGGTKPPQLNSLGRTLRMNSESRLVLSPRRGRTSGHASDSELT
ncbi:hypothetical protein ACHQM5_000338 [Ranunculus cassubicifolius]